MKLSKILHSSFQETQKQRTGARDCLRDADGSWTLSGDEAEQLSKESGMRFLVSETIRKTLGEVSQIHKSNRDTAIEDYENDIDADPGLMLLQMAVQYPRPRAIRETILMLIRK